jgi:integrase
MMAESTPVVLPDLDPAPPNLAPHADTAQALAAASISANTRRAYTTALGRLDTWLADMGVPLSDPTLAEYLSELFAAGKAPAVAAMVVAAVKFRAKLTGMEGPVGPATARVLAGFRRAGRTRGRGQVEGVRWEQADAAAALAVNEETKLSGVRDAAILAVASDALLRVSELAALTVADIDLTEQTITVQRSKTDQEGTGAVLFLGKPTIQRVQAWLDAASIREGALFRALTKGGKVRAGLSARSLRTIIAKRSKAAGVPGRVSGHSLRVGSAQSLAAAGASVVEMQQAGRWKSPAMPGQYARKQIARRGAVARLRYKA